MKKIRISISLSVALMTCLSPQRAFSEWSLNSPFLFTVPSQFLDQQLSRNLQTLSSATLQLPDQTISNPIQTTIGQITVQIHNLNGALKVLEPGHAWQISAPQLAAQVLIGRIQASQIIHQVVNGINFDVSVSGTCSNIQLTLPAGSAQLSAAAQLSVSQNQVAAQLTSFALNWSPSAWQVTTPSCTGPYGFGALLSQYLTGYLAQPANLQQLISAQLQSSVTDVLNKAVGSAFAGLTVQTHRTDITVTLHADALKSVGNGFLVAGHVLVTLPLANPGQSVTESTDPLPSVQDVGGVNAVTLNLPESAILKILSHVQDTSLLSRLIHGSDILAFSGFLKNRFEQFFVFPDLKKFSTSSDFVFSTALPAPLQSSIVSSSQSNALTLNVKGSLATQMLAPHNGSTVPYVNFLAPFQTQAQFQIQNGQLKTTLSKAKLKIAATWDPHYVSLYRPDQRLWLGPITSKMKSALTAEPILFQLPGLSLQSGTTYEAIGLSDDTRLKVISVQFGAAP